MIIAAAAMLTSCKSTPTVEWNLTAQVRGNGEVVVSYPTGSLSVTGDAKVAATTARETSDTLTVSYALNSGNERLVEAAKAVQKAGNGAFVVEVLKGEWQADVTGYAKYGEFYFVVDEHYPAVPNETFGFAVKAPMDTATVE